MQLTELGKDHHKTPNVQKLLRQNLKAAMKQPAPAAASQLDDEGGISPDS